MEYISVAVEGMGRRYPIKTVEIIANLPDGSALVTVRFPSYSIAGEISVEAKAQLMGHRLLTGDKVVIAKKDNALIKWLNEPQPLGPPENWLEKLKRYWSELDSGTPE